MAGWGHSYGAAAEWYQGRFTARAGIFELSAVPAGTALNATAYGLDPNLSQFQVVGEIEERHELWGQPGKLKLTGFLNRGRAGSFQDAVNIAAGTGIDPSLALALDRRFRNRPGVSLDLEQQVIGNRGLFRARGLCGWQAWSPGTSPTSTARPWRATRSRASNGAGRSTRWASR